MRKDSDNAKLLEPGELPSKRKVLVVEDNELNRDILSSFLEEKFDVFLAENGEEGLYMSNKFSKQYTINIYDIDSNYKCKYSSLMNYLCGIFG